MQAWKRKISSPLLRDTVCRSSRYAPKWPSLSIGRAESLWHHYRPAFSYTKLLWLRCCKHTQFRQETSSPIKLLLYTYKIIPTCYCTTSFSKYNSYPLHSLPDWATASLAGHPTIKKKPFHPFRLTESAKTTAQANAHFGQSHQTREQSLNNANENTRKGLWF